MCVCGGGGGKCFFGGSGKKEQARLVKHSSVLLLNSQNIFFQKGQLRLQRLQANLLPTTYKGSLNRG